jgi:RimJ/RimL family protein N-acetyltransferase
VAEAFRRRGIAAAALKQLIAEVPEGIRTIEASVDADNIPSLRLFEKLGFRRCGWSEGLLTYRLTL